MLLRGRCLHLIPTTQTKTILFTISLEREEWSNVVIAGLGRLREEDGKLKGKMMETVKRSVVAGSRGVKMSRWGRD